MEKAVKGVVSFGSVRKTSLLVPAAGVEPATSRSGGERSNPLSYAGIGERQDSIGVTIIGKLPLVSA